MKYTLFLFLLCSLFAQAQTVTKSYVLGTDGTTYFEVTTTTQEDESATTTKVRIGPAASLASDQADKIESQSRDLAGNAFAVSRTNLRLNEIGAVDADILALTTVSPLKIIQARYATELLKSGWTIDKGDGGRLCIACFHDQWKQQSTLLNKRGGNQSGNYLRQCTYSFWLPINRIKHRFLPC